MNESKEFASELSLDNKILSTIQFFQSESEKVEKEKFRKFVMYALYSGFKLGMEVKKDDEAFPNAYCINHIENINKLWFKGEAKTL